MLEIRAVIHINNTRADAHTVHTHTHTHTHSQLSRLLHIGERFALRNYRLYKHVLVEIFAPSMPLFHVPLLNIRPFMTTPTENLSVVHVCEAELYKYVKSTHSRILLHYNSACPPQVNQRIHCLFAAKESNYCCQYRGGSYIYTRESIRSQICC